MMQIDLNCDLGESFGAWQIGNDRQILPLISSANVACGFHASDPVVMRKTVQAAAKAGVAVGAHPGYPDLMGFGRRAMTLSSDEARSYMLYQLGALDAFCRTAGLRLQHVKPHGALYNMASKDYQLARDLCEAVASYDPELILLGLSGGELLHAAADIGLPFASEVFADRAYEEDGSLVSRSKPGSMITDEEEAIRRVIRMVREGKVTAITGRDIPIRADSVCVHGDGPQALAFVQKIREACEAEGIGIRALGR